VRPVQAPVTERDRAVRGDLEGRARLRQLPREWVVDGAQRGDGDRQERLGRLEAEGEMTVGAVLDAPVFPMLDLADRTRQAIFENVLATDPSEETRSLLSGSEDDGQMPC
jgi:hypothetical protein